jgi:hypothetical protein
MYFLPSRVPMQVDMVDEQTPHSVEYRNDDHGEELEEGEDVGSIPHVVLSVGL